MRDDRSTSKAKRPIMALLEILSQRWTLRILWELRDGPLTSRALRDATEISPTVLQARLDTLRNASIIELVKGTGYGLTSLGEELIADFAPLYSFASRWSKATENTNESADEAEPGDSEGRPHPQSAPVEAEAFAERVLRYFYPVHYRFGMEMEQAMGQGRLGRKQAALLWLIHSEAGTDGWMPRKDIEAKLGGWFEMSSPNVTKIIHDTASVPHEMIEIIDSPGSGREKRLRLTESGQNFVSTMIVSANLFLSGRVGHMPQPKLAAGLAFLEEAFGPETNLPV